MTHLAARYPGSCRVCDRHFPAGEVIDWRKGIGGTHLRCLPASERRSLRRLARQSYRGPEPIEPDAPVDLEIERAAEDRRIAREATAPEGGLTD